MNQGTQHPTGGNAGNQGGQQPQQGQPATPPVNNPQQMPAQGGSGAANQGGQKPEESKKVIAGVLGILLGWAGVHKFILGYHMEGGVMLGISLIGWVTSCFTFGIPVMIISIIGLIEGIIYLTKTDEEFIETYQRNKKGWF